MSKRSTLLLAVIALAVGAGLWTSRLLFPAPFAASRVEATSFTVLPTPRTLPAFALQQSDGTTLSGEELRGHWTLVFLGFTHCPDICPTTLAQLAAAQKRWTSLPEARRPRVLFVSADPGRDSPQQVGRYAHAFHPDTLAATAPVPQLEAFARSLSLVFMKVAGSSGAAADYSIDHSAALVLLDPQARMAGVAQPPFDVDGLAADLARLTASAPAHAMQGMD